MIYSIAKSRQHTLLRRNSALHEKSHPASAHSYTFFSCIRSMCLLKSALQTNLQSEWKNIIDVYRIFFMFHFNNINFLRTDLLSAAIYHHVERWKSLWPLNNCHNIWNFNDSYSPPITKGTSERSFVQMSVSYMFR